MRGDLGTSSVVDLCRGLAEASSTGTVELEGPEGSGNVIFRHGRVVWAQSPAPRARLGDRLVNAALLSQEQLDQALEVQARSEESTKLGALLVEQGLVTKDVIRVFVQEQILDAVFDLMRWREGIYEFHAGEAVDEKLPVDIPVDQLLVEVSRRQSEWDEIERAIPDLDMIPDFRTGGSSAAASLEPDEFAMLANVDGRRSIRELASHLGYSEFEAARIVYGLTLLGVVSVGEEAEEPEQVEAEFDLAPSDEVETEPAATDVEETPDAEELDIGLALEEALSGSGDDTPRSRPPIRVHVDDEGRFPEPTGVEPPPAQPAEEPVAEEPEPAEEPATAEEPAAEEPATAEEPAAEEPEPVEEPATAEEWSFEEPEPWTPDDVEPVEPTATVEPEATEEQPVARPARDLDDEDFETLINELAGASEPRDREPPETPYRARPEPSPQPSAPDRDEAADADEPEPEPEREPEPREERGTSDVSEFLRELSRLAVDDEETSPRQGAPKEPRPETDEKPPRPERTEDPKADDKTQDDRKKKGGFFGWGR